ncbi:MAG TPA: sugar transferase [Caulobacteraceae bacterium]|nr:sugar transferase [Caulobacteraceae bacterium]
MAEFSLAERSPTPVSSERQLPQGRSWSGRAFDITASLILLIFFGPFILLIVLAIYLQDGGPILFSQTRLGFGGRSFRCLKFRSMGVDAEARLVALLDNCSSARAEWERDHKLKADPRITAVGRVLRKTSLDELPQLFNVLIGDMTLVGPRPIVHAEIWRYGPRFRHYCSVLPGLTGLWQVSGRSDASYRARVAMDVLYVKKRSPLLDLKILLATLPAVLFSRGSY